MVRNLNFLKDLRPRLVNIMDIIGSGPAGDLEAPAYSLQSRADQFREVCEVDPLLCRKYRGRMKVIAFLTEYSAVDRIIDHVKLTFVAEKPPPSRVLTEVALMAAEERAEYC